MPIKLLSKLWCIVAMSFALQGCRTDLKGYWYKERFRHEYVPFDRAALPELRTFVIDDDQLETYLESMPADDTEKLGAAVKEKVNVIRTTIQAIEGFPDGSEDAKTPADVTRQLLPDVIALDFSKAIDFATFNGRLHGDLATNVMVSLIFGRNDFSDDIVEDKTFLDNYPYLERPNNK